MRSPFLPKRANLLLKGPCVGWLLIQLPVRVRHRLGSHQAARRKTFQRSGAFLLADPIAYPLRIDSGINDQMRDVNVFWSELARCALRDCAKAELGTGESGISW